MNKIIEQVIQALKKEKSLGTQIILPDGTRAEINIENFLPLSDSNEKTIAYVDGGNAEIIGAPNFSLQLIRTFYTVYQNNKRIACKRDDFYALVTAEGERSYKVQFFNRDLVEMKFDAFDKTLMSGDHRATPQRIAELIRKLSEIEKINEIEADIVVRDGDLVAEHETEKEIYSTLQGKYLVGLSKTTNMITETGNSAAIVLSKLSEMNKWAYKINEDICFVKLNEHSKHVFRLDCKNPEQVLGLLAENSKDVSFPGYPYGLIEADNMAKVSKQEQNRLKMLFSSNEEIQEMLSSGNAHDILNII